MQNLNPNKVEIYLDALAEMVQAVNADFSEESLLRLYQLTLIGHLRLGRFSLMVEEDGNWQTKAYHGLKQPVLHGDVLELVNAVKKVSRLDDWHETESLRQFEYVIPALRQVDSAGSEVKENTIALLFVSDIEEDLRIQTSHLYKFLYSITHLMTQSIYNRRMELVERGQQLYRRELALAAQVQAGLFPEHLPDSGPVAAAAAQRAHISVSGDYYDFLEVRSGVYLFCIADVSGKGFPAALLMSNLQATLRTLAGYERSLSIIVQVLNSAIHESAHGDRFVTAFLGIIDLQQGTLQYVNAGHHPPLMVSNATGAQSYLTSKCTLLGIFSPLPEVEVVTVPLPAGGATIHMYTDGFVETFNPLGEEFGTDRLADVVLADTNCVPLAATHQALFTALDRYRGSVDTHDDITLFSVRVQG